MKTRVSIRKASGETIFATAVNISSSGMLLHLEPASPLQLGEEVTVEVALAEEPEQPLSTWGLATVVRLDGLQSAIQLSAGSFSDLRPNDADFPEADDER